MVARNGNCRIDPIAIRQCRPTYVRAIGTADGVADTASQAVRDACDEAKQQRDQAEPMAIGLQCPARGTCHQVGRVLKTGGGLDWTRPEKILKGADAGKWFTTATAYSGYSHYCATRKVPDPDE
jgi:hypothetical protein